MSNNLCELIFESNLVQLVDSPTHVCGNILDLVLTDNPDHVTNLLVHPPDYQCVTSDHYLITFTITLHLVSSPTITEVFLTLPCKGDLTGLSEYLLSRDLSSIYKSSDIEEIWHLLKSHIIPLLGALNTETATGTCMIIYSYMIPFIVTFSDLHYIFLLLRREFQQCYNH